MVTLERYENGILSVQRRTQLLKGFESRLEPGHGVVHPGGRWDRWGGSATGCLGELFRPLDQIEEVTRQFASGQLAERGPPPPKF